MRNGDMRNTGICLLLHRNGKFSARIPHQSAARASLAASFPPGEAICTATVKLSDKLKIEIPCIFTFRR